MRKKSDKIEMLSLIEKGVEPWRIASKFKVREDFIRRWAMDLPRAKKRKPPKLYKWYWTVADVEDRWGIPIRQLIQDLVDQGFSLRKVSLVLGCGRETVRAHAKGIVLPPKEL